MTRLDNTAGWSVWPLVWIAASWQAAFFEYQLPGSNSGRGAVTAGWPLGDPQCWRPKADQTFCVFQSQGPLDLKFSLAAKHATGFQAIHIPALCGVARTPMLMAS